MSSNAWALVAQRDFMVRLRDKTFIGSILFSLLILVGVLGFQIWNGNQESTYDVAVTPRAAAMGQVLVDQAPELDEKVTVELTEVASGAAAKSAVQDESVDAWLAPTKDGWQLVGKSKVDAGLLSVAETAIRAHVLAANAAQAGTDVASLRAGSAVTTEVLDGDAEQQFVGRAVGFGMAFLFYMAAIMFGMYLAVSVTEEKQSRIVEIIATSIPLRHLLVGKLLAAVALAVLQLAVYGIVAVIGVTFTQWGDLLPSITSGLAWFLVFFVVGFTMIAAMFAVAGSLASRQEDIQSTAMPVTVLLVVMFFGGIFAQGTLADVLAWIPPFSAVLQPMRLISGQSQWWEAVVSLGLLLVATAAVLALAERIYRRALMQTSGKLSVTAAWKAEI